MSETESDKTRGESRQAALRTLIRMIRVVAACAVLGGLVGAIYNPRSGGLVVAFFAFVAYLISDFFLRRR